MKIQDQIIIVTNIDVLFLTSREIITKPLNIFIAKKIISPHFLLIAISLKIWAGCILSVF